MRTEIALRDLVLVGGGHSHVGVLRSFGMRPLPGLRLTLVSRETHTPYSGMLPGYVAGHYAYDDVHIDLARLAAFAGARYLHAEAIGIDRAGRKLVCAGRPPIPYDLLSIDIGATPRMDEVEGAREFAVPVKPIHQLDARWRALLERVRSRESAPRIALVGAGAAGVELALSIHHRLGAELRSLGRDAGGLRVLLFQAGARILPTHNAAVRRRLERVLAERGIEVHRDSAIRRVEAGRIETAQGATFEADEILWVTSASGAPWLRATGLALDSAGFIRVARTLRSVSDPRIFAAGDVASLEGHALEKAGVFAVRMGPVLARNLRRVATGEDPLPYRPQRKFLALISTGDRYAVASRGRLCLAGAWAWRWKDWIDRRFMARFSELRPMGAQAPLPAGPIALEPEEAQQAQAASAMRCGGCGAKVGAGSLARALARLRGLERDDVLIGLSAPDDAAVLRVPPGMALVHTVDFFRAFVDDPFLLGKVAANHALGDVFAMGARAWTASAIVLLPPGLEAKVEEDLAQMMAGALEVLDAAGCALVGGHSGEGREPALGFAVQGLVEESLSRVLRKGGMRPGELLVLTKPLGTGVLLAAHARLAARGRWIDAAMESMCASSRQAAECLVEHGASACTDVTGFGLYGALLEMVRASGLGAELRLSALPLLEGAAECAAAGIRSSLHPANQRLAQPTPGESELAGHPAYPLLFDPQTAGGLLASLPAARAPACVEALHRLGATAAVLVGRTLAPREGAPAIELRS